MINTLPRFVSPFRYPGGKARLATFVENTLKNNFREPKKITLVEPYAGGAGASLTLLFASRINKIIINDLDKAIYAFWKTSLSDSDYLINKIKRTEITIEEWKKQRQIYLGGKGSLRKLAFAVMYLNRTNRSGIIEGGPIGGIQQTGKWKIDARFSKDVMISRLKKIKEHRSKIVVKNLDGIALLKNLEHKSNPNDYFIFLDPPYYKKGKLLYLNHYSDNNHEELAKFLKNTKLKWVMTYDDVGFIHDLYGSLARHRFTIHHSAHQSKQGKEVAIFSDRIVSSQEMALGN